MNTIIKPNYGKCKVVYYPTINYGNNVKRVVKVTAILNMTSQKRGVVESAVFETLDKVNTSEMSNAIITEAFAKSEIGKGKNLISCYEIETI